ncbi:MAG: YdbL family protein [Bdellovibrionales bacterium]|nr:YdbL family protein [Bdellovibrionales bacterium]
MSKMIKTSIRILATFTLFSLTSLNAFALELDQAKAKGLVGETPTGYLAPVNKASADVKALVDDINRKRRAEYERIAKKNGTPLKTVEVLAGKKAIEKTPGGQYVLLPSGEW